MTEEQLETRLRCAMLDQAAQVHSDAMSDQLALVAARDASGTIRTRPRTALRVGAPVVSGVAVVALASVLVAQAGDHGSPNAKDAHGGRAPAAAAPTTVPAAAPTLTYVRDTVRGKVVSETWIPADRSQTWQFTNPNMDGAARNDRGKCAAFPHYVDQNQKVPSCDGGSWDMYRPMFADSLPDDPHAVLASMRTAMDGPSDAATFNTGWQFLSLGWVQPAAVAKVVGALKLIHGVRVTALSDGRTKLSYSGHLKRTVREYWSLTVDAQHRLVATGFSWGTTKTETDVYTYKQVSAIGER